MLANMTPAKGQNFVQRSDADKCGKNGDIRPGKYGGSMIPEAQEGVDVSVAIDETVHAMHPECMN